MKLLFIIAHPKHIFIFKNIIEYFDNKNIPYIIFAVDKDIVIELLNTFKFKYEIVGKNKSGLINNFIEIPKRIYRSLIKTKKFEPTIIIGQADPFFAIIGKMLSIPTLFLPDTESSFISRFIAFPLASKLIIPESYSNHVKQKHIRLNHYLELAYLHPKYIKTTENVYDLLKIRPNEKYVIMRYVSWNSHHDIGHKGITLPNKIKAVNQFLKYGKVFISSEEKLPSELEGYRISIQIEKIHQVMKTASLFFGESATMATESSVMGTPSIYIDNVGRGYTHDIEKKYGLMFNFTESLSDQEKAIEKGIYILKNNLKEKLKKNKEELINDKIDISSYLINFIEQLHVPNN